MQAWYRSSVFNLCQPADVQYELRTSPAGRQPRSSSPPQTPPDPDIPLDETTTLPAAVPHLQSDGVVSLAELLIVDPNQPFDTLEEMP